MHVAEFLDAFVFGPDVEVVKPLLPDVLRSVVEEEGLRRIASLSPLGQKAARKSKFKSLHHGRGSLYLRFADEEVNMFGHGYVTDDDKLIALACLLEHGEKQVTTAGSTEQRLRPVCPPG
jgi:hypothetical protein